MTLNAEVIKTYGGDDVSIVGVHATSGPHEILELDKNLLSICTFIPAYSSSQVHTIHQSRPVHTQQTRGSWRNRFNFNLSGCACTSVEELLVRRRALSHERSRTNSKATGSEGSVIKNTSNAPPNKADKDDSKKKMVADVKRCYYMIPKNQSLSYYRSILETCAAKAIDRGGIYAQGFFGRPVFLNDILVANSSSKMKTSTTVRMFMLAFRAATRAAVTYIHPASTKDHVKLVTLEIVSIKKHLSFDYSLIAIFTREIRNNQFIFGAESMYVPVQLLSIFLAILGNGAFVKLLQNTWVNHLRKNKKKTCSPKHKGSPTYGQFTRGAKFSTDRLLNIMDAIKEYITSDTTSLPALGSFAEWWLPRAQTRKRIYNDENGEMLIFDEQKIVHPQFSNSYAGKVRFVLEVKDKPYIIMNDATVWSTNCQLAGYDRRAVGFAVEQLQAAGKYKYFDGLKNVLCANSGIIVIFHKRTLYFFKDISTFLEHKDSYYSIPDVEQFCFCEKHGLAFARRKDNCVEIYLRPIPTPSKKIEKWTQCWGGFTLSSTVRQLCIMKDPYDRNIYLFVVFDNDKLYYRNNKWKQWKYVDGGCESITVGNGRVVLHLKRGAYKKTTHALAYLDYQKNTTWALSKNKFQNCKKCLHIGEKTELWLTDSNQLEVRNSDTQRISRTLCNIKESFLFIGQKFCYYSQDQYRTLTMISYLSRRIPFGAREDKVSRTLQLPLIPSVTVNKKEKEEEEEEETEGEG